ncbi:NAD(P)-dependent oxidoreductase [Streptosporangium sp. NPDC001559]|uniref:NAD(P)-dependent oxidoreductase n=1 Tax=Streptosporangium sp. NPDC001559 TaxID=3366187 RepID=UPI0036EBE97B
MRLIVFGATGGTGLQVVVRALDAGHDVTAVVRDPARLGAGGVAGGGAGGDPRLTVIRGDVLEPEPWRRNVGGHDAVLSCLGSRDRKHPTTVYSRGTSNIVDAMLGTGVRRLLCLSSAGLEIPPGTPLAQRLVTRLVIQRLYRYGYADMAAMERLVKTCSVDWTIIRPPMLTDKPATGHPRAAVDGHLEGLRSVSRADLADYMIGHVEDRETWGRTVEVGS